MIIKHCLHRILPVLLLANLISFGVESSIQAKPELSPQSISERRIYVGENSSLPPGFQIVSSTPASLVLDLQALSIGYETVVHKAGTCQLLSAEGFIRNASPGAPALLSAGVLIGIPFDSTPDLVIKSMDTVDFAAEVDVCPIATPLLQTEMNGLVSKQGEVLQEDSRLYSTDSFLPDQPVELNVIGMIRNQQVARLSFSPILYNPARDKLVLIRHITVEILFGKLEKTINQPVTIDEGQFEQVLQKVLINYEQARNWRLSPEWTTVGTTSMDIYPALIQPAYKLGVNRDGIYQVTYAQLLLAGVPVESLDPRSFRLFNQQVEIPIVVSGEDDSIFDPSDYILFYGQKINTKFTDTNIYWLYWGGDPGARIAVQDGSVHDAILSPSFRATEQLEENHGYISRSPSGPGNDHWYWTMLNAYQGPIWRDFSFNLQHLPASASPATLNGLFKGYFADPQHHTRLYINGHLLDDYIWSSTAEYSFTLEFPPEYLFEGSNTISVELPFDDGISTDQVLVNWFMISYDDSYIAKNNLLEFSQPGQRKLEVSGFITDDIDIFETTDPNTPIRVLGGSITPVDAGYQISFEQPLSGEHHYMVLSPTSWLTPTSIIPDIPSNLKDDSNGADYLIISYVDFIDAVQPIAAYHAIHGLRVKVVDVQDIYDEFNNGVFSPQAIQDFITYAYSNWTSPAPTYVLLVGDGHYDFHDYYGGSGPNYMPPFLGEFDPWIGETASDNRFVTISGNDILPDIFIGRLPVNTITETVSVVNKVLTYGQGLADEDWDSHLSFVADNADGAGNFPASSDNLADHYSPVDYNIEKIYFGIDPYTSAEFTRQAITSAINDGRLIVNYNGHGSIQNWASEDLFSLDDLDNLVNIGKYPFFVPMTCLEGYFIFPKIPRYNLPSLAESLVVAHDKGAIASWSPAGFGLSNGHDLLAQGFYQALFVDDLTRFGQATTFAKYHLAANSPAYQDLIDTYNLFGDPGIRLKASTAFTIDLPLIIR